MPDADLADDQVEDGTALFIATLVVRDIFHQVLVLIVLPTADATCCGVDGDVGTDQRLSERVPEGRVFRHRNCSWHKCRGD